MADVTISQLTNATPSPGSIIPINQGGVTLSTTLAQLSSLPFIPKVWVNFDGTGTIGQNQTIRASYNVDRVLKNGTGDYTVFFATPFADSNYCVSTMGWQPNNNINSVYAWPKATPTYSTTYSTNFIRIASGTPHVAGFHNESIADAHAVFVTVYGN